MSIFHSTLYTEYISQGLNDIVYELTVEPQKRSPVGMGITRTRQFHVVYSGPLLSKPMLCLPREEMDVRVLAYCEIRRTSTVERSNSSKKGRAAKPSYAGCIPASSCTAFQLAHFVQKGALDLLTMMVLPLYCRIWHDRPTSLQPPKPRKSSCSEGSTVSSSPFATADSFLLVAILSAGRCS